MRLSIVKVQFAALLAISLFTNRAFAQSFASSCPNIQCVQYDDKMEPDNLCLAHSGDIPTTSIKLRNCNDLPNSVCNLIEYDKFAWPNVTQQFKTNTSMTDPRQSPLFGKQLEVKCTDKNDLLETQLQNGRSCLEDIQCLSKKCDWDAGICVGRKINQTCKDHSQCNAGLACMAARTWPFTTTCQAQLAENVTNCTSDFDCANNMGCIIVVDNRTQVNRCVKYYSLNGSTLFTWDQEQYNLQSNLTTFLNLTKEAILYHGKFCKSGFANRFSLNRAQCVDIDNVRLSNDVNTVVASPYQCRADGSVICIYQTGNLKRFSLQCECGFDSTTGYCPLPDQTFMSNLANYSRSLYDGNQCHTLDRHNIIAQKECGIGQFVTQINTSVKFQQASDYQFQLKYWTFTRTVESYSCMNNIFPTSQLSIMAFAKSLVIIRNLVITLSVLSASILFL
ncbi:UNKNOWN [Stylonychia lemnae]|uniref:Dickkopf N-terminal cysteine-rich domain-containing protein n=1 Tax=Stylonychia lemnae TaxID=5949 RepID=A0A078ANS0_STYLE|nr:UNKNOWN [Stylonychia lemnae]|eukprot:CDW83995.1 UNKNOWN [Stylonychia lemnae]